MEAEHLQAPNSNRAWDEAEKQVVSFLRWLDKWDLDATPKGDEFHRESRIIFHIIIYTVINASRFPPTFLPSYIGKGTRAGISETILRTQRLHNKVNLPGESGKARAPCSLPASGSGPCALQSTLTLLVPGNAGLGLSRPGGPGDGSTLAPLLCSEAGAQGCSESTPGLCKVCFLLSLPAGLKSPSDR